MNISPEIILTNSIITKDDGNNTGSIEIAFEGGTPPYLAEWDNGALGVIITNLSFGDYTVTITDVKGCTGVFSFTVELETATISHFEKNLNLNISPNPFSVTTQLNYELSSSHQVRIDILNSRGQLIENLFAGDQFPGTYSLDWKAKNHAVGIYYFKIQIDEKLFVEKTVLLR